LAETCVSLRLLTSAATFFRHALRRAQEDNPHRIVKRIIRHADSLLIRWPPFLVRLVIDIPVPRRKRQIKYIRHQHRRDVCIGKNHVVIFAMLDRAIKQNRGNAIIQRRLPPTGCTVGPTPARPRIVGSRIDWDRIGLYFLCVHNSEHLAWRYDMSLSLRGEDSGRRVWPIRTPPQTKPERE
jgi:hypothetical protein